MTAATLIERVDKRTWMKWWGEVGVTASILALFALLMLLGNLWILILPLIEHICKV